VERLGWKDISYDGTGPTATAATAAESLRWFGKANSSQWWWMHWVRPIFRGRGIIGTMLGIRHGVADKGAWSWIDYYRWMLRRM